MSMILWQGYVCLSGCQWTSKLFSAIPVGIAWHQEFVNCFGIDRQSPVDSHLCLLCGRFMESSQAYNVGKWALILLSTEKYVRFVHHKSAAGHQRRGTDVTLR